MDSAATTGLPTDEAGALADETLLVRVAATICELTCGLTSECKSREAAQGLLDRGYLRRLAPVTGRDREDVVHAKIEHPYRPYEADYEYTDLLRRVKTMGGARQIVGILQQYALANPRQGSFAGSLWAIAEWLSERLPLLALSQPAETPEKAVVPICCYCDADLSCAKCGREQPAETPEPQFRSQVFRAAERANKQFGQWMPQQWLEIFIGEMMVTPDD